MGEGRGGALVPLCFFFSLLSCLFPFLPANETPNMDYKMNGSHLFLEVQTFPSTLSVSYTLNFIKLLLRISDLSIKIEWGPNIPFFCFNWFQDRTFPLPAFLLHPLFLSPLASCMSLLSVCPTVCVKESPSYRLAPPWAA